LDGAGRLTPARSAGPQARAGRAALAGSLALLVLLAWPARAFAHGLAILTIHGDGRGAVWVTAEWEDGHPITEPVGAVITATSSTGQRIGPAPLGRLPDGRLSYHGTLPPGEWTVVAEMGTPAVGQCTGRVPVAASGATAIPTEIRCGTPNPVTAPPGQAQTSSTTGTWLWLAVAVAILVAVGVVAMFARRKRSPSARVRAGRR
jgi:hypothetical protein